MYREICRFISFQSEVFSISCFKRNKSTKSRTRLKNRFYFASLKAQVSNWGKSSFFFFWNIQYNGRNSQKTVILTKAQISLRDNPKFYTFQLLATQTFTSLWNVLNLKYVHWFFSNQDRVIIFKVLFLCFPSELSLRISGTVKTHDSQPELDFLASG